MIPLASEQDRLGAALIADGRVRVPLARLWELWSSAAPRLVAHPDQAAALDAALRALAGAGTVELPSGAWDRSTVPPLPRSVLVPSSRRVRSVPRWRRRPWRTELGWVASLPALSDDQFDELVTIDCWLRDHADKDVPVVPVRYRSVELFGAEKRLERLARGALFGPGRLSLAMLACRHLPPPLAAVALGDGPDVLVVENSDTYWVAVDAVRAAGYRCRVGAVVWGSGNSFPSQMDALVVDVAGRGPVSGTVWYWGDLDPAGVTIAAGAAAGAARLDVDFRAPAALWRATATAPHQDAGAVDWSPALAAAAWFGALWECFTPVVAGSARVAQEAVPAGVIEAWVDGLDRRSGL